MESVGVDGLTPRDEARFIASPLTHNGVTQSRNGQHLHVMHYALLAFFLVWFIILAPLRVVLITAIGCFLIAASVRAIASSITGMQIGYGASIRAVGLSVILSFIALLLIAGGFSHMTVVTLFVLNPLVVAATLLLAYVLGYHLCLGTTFGTSAIVALLSTAASAVIILGLRTVA